MLTDTSQLASLQMLMQQVEKHDGGYNEIIIDAKAWEASLPETIAAVFYPAFAHDDEAGEEPTCSQVDDFSASLSNLKTLFR